MEYSALDEGQIDEWRWFVDLMHMVREIERDNDIREMKGYCSGIQKYRKKIEALVEERYKGFGRIGLRYDESGCKARFPNLYKSVEILSIRDSSLYTTLTEFYDRYDEIYAYVEEKEGQLTEEKIIGHYDIRYFLADRSVYFYRVQDELEEYESNNDFYLLKIENEFIKRAYRLLKKDKYKLKLLKLYIQEYIRLLYPAKWILGMDLYNQTDRIEVFITHKNQMTIKSVKEDMIEQALSVASVYMLKKIIEIECGGCDGRVR